MIEGTIGANGEKLAAGGDYNSCGSSESAAVYRWPKAAGGLPTNAYTNLAGSANRLELHSVRKV